MWMLLDAYLMQSLYLEFNVSSASLPNPHIAMNNGTIAVPDGPGMCVEVDTEQVDWFWVL